MEQRAAQIRVAIVNDYEVVVAGLAAMLLPHVDRVLVVEIDTGLPVISDVDVILYDTFGQVQGDGVDLQDLVRGGDAKVLVYSWNTQPDLVDRSLAQGAHGYVSKSFSAEDLVRAVEAVAGGELVRPGPEPVAVQPPGRWPGKEHGLSMREAEVLALIAQGLSNQEIADRSYLSINSVKTYIRTAYRKIDVSRRSQAVAWGMTHGLSPEQLRVVDPAAH
ncbi:response regulator transcription factor [Nocardioides sp. cx-169]|uniref:response regulator transcription factor n=1 Tax=Nocardioides sp. cx-169 TaxID=2899080 RepID=UPI001E53E5E6|nr:response regulator transcription factor [Nocardioides sp. cx-169]MCD4534031.1 response regulator transcription factor [Nocardioides sp. cx-169]